MPKYLTFYILLPRSVSLSSQQYQSYKRSIKYSTAADMRNARKGPPMWSFINHFCRYNTTRTEPYMRLERREKIYGCACWRNSRYSSSMPLSCTQ
uniref:Secreted protein n=1 Tax=Parascaris equorum TaxID=6256 RepID=A0A914R6H3_PAREQ